MPDNDAPRNEEALDETIEESFPASDAPANTPETGISLPSADSLPRCRRTRRRISVTADRLLVRSA